MSKRVTKAYPGGYRRYGPNDADRALDRKEAGVSVAQIAAIMECSHKTVTRLIRSARQARILERVVMQNG